MSARLKQLEVTKVDFVDAGDNKGAHVVLFKRAVPPDNQKGAFDTMKIDKSKLTTEELAVLEAIEKKAGIPDAPPAETGAGTGTLPEPVPAPEPASKSAPAHKPAAAPAPIAQPVMASAPAAPAVLSNTVAEDEDIYKGLHPAIRAELEHLRKQADAMEERELREVAKKYEIIGKKPEELVPLLKSLKAAGGEAYSQMISILDASVQAVEKSGLFSEVGKRGAGDTSGSDSAWAKIEKQAAALRAADPKLGYHASLDIACVQHPELVHEYEDGR